MPNPTKELFLTAMRERFGELRKLDFSQSLYQICGKSVRVYVRYSRVHDRNKGFYGLRASDLRKLEGSRSFICFLWDGQREPLLVPYSEYEDIFASTSPAPDGQFKVQIYIQEEGVEMYVAKAGRFNVEGHFGWHEIEAGVDSSKLMKVPPLSHSQVQTMLGAIGVAKNCDIWIPANDRPKLDWGLSIRYDFRGHLPSGFDRVQEILQEVDVIWVRHGSSDLAALFEVEHSTPIYSGLLRLNDIHLASPGIHPRFSVVSNDERRSVFARQLGRPTFQASGLGEICTFLDYVNVFEWHERTKRQRSGVANEKK